MRGGIQNDGMSSANSTDKVAGKVTVGFSGGAGGSGGKQGKGGDTLRGTGATGAGNETAKVDLYPADIQAPDINKRVPPGVLNDPKLQALGFAHGQTNTPNALCQTASQFGGIESIDQDSGYAFDSDGMGDESGAGGRHNI